MSRLKDDRDLISKPGDTILETIEHFKMSQVELAERMGKTPSKVNDIISGKEPISVVTAFQLEKVLGIDAQFWLNREMIFRETLSRIEQEEFLENCKDWLKTQPLKELKACGYLKSRKVGPEMVDECLKYYGVATPAQWQTTYVDKYFASRFRKSEAHKSTLGAFAAWLRMGEIEMRKQKLVPYDKKVFKQNLLEIRNLVREHPEDYASQLQQYCLKAGVVLVYTLCIPKAPISGAARWIGDNPLIQLTDRYKTNDHFWFSFFHEVAHILLHGKKDVFVENLNEFNTDLEKEREADEFANKFLLPEDITINLPSKVSEKDIKKIARENKTHPAIVLGRLQHLDILPYSFPSDLKFKVVLDDHINKSGDF